MELYNNHQNQLIERVFQRIDAELLQSAPFLAAHITAWMQNLSGSHAPADYFKHPFAVPFLLFPWWIEEQITGTVDDAFQQDVMYSSVCAYYFSRMVDNLVDGDADITPPLIPASGYFHQGFQGTYFTYFPHEHEFWQFFRQTWLHQAEVTAQDATLSAIDAVAFEQIASQKISAIKIPIAAACYHYQRADLIPLWMQVVDLWGCWHMFFQDMFDWLKDSHNNNMTYFLTEAAKHDAPSSWIIREGIDWGVARLDSWMVDLLKLTDELGSESLKVYLNYRNDLLHTQRQKMESGLKLLSTLGKSK